MIYVDGANQFGGVLRVRGPVGFKAAYGQYTVHIQGVHTVQPHTLRSTGIPQIFTPTEPFEIDETGRGKLHIQPVLIGPGNQYQNVDNLPADGARVEFK